MILNKTRDRHLQENCVLFPTARFKVCESFGNDGDVMGNGYEILFKFASPFEMMETLLVMDTENLFG